mgnify:CR=1 FL=1
MLSDGTADVEEEFSDCMCISHKFGYCLGVSRTSNRQFFSFKIDR